MDRLSSRHARRTVGLYVIALLAALMASSGCGGPLSLTGGSIPIGSSLLKGVVVRADNPAQAVGGATATLTLDALRNGNRSTDVSGAFAFQKIMGGNYTCSIHPPAGSDLAPNWSWAFDLPDNARTQLVAAVWPGSFNIGQVAAVTLTPTQVTLRVGQSGQFSAAALDASGHALPIRPSLLLVGDVGDLSPDGSIQARTAGHGTLVAWVNGYTAAVDITVVP